MNTIISINVEAAEGVEKQLRASSTLFSSSVERPSGPPDTRATSLLNRALLLAGDRLDGLSKAMNHESSEAAANVSATVADIMGVEDAIAAQLRRTTSAIEAAISSVGNQ